jgi:hypothetical protein
LQRREERGKTQNRGCGGLRAQIESQPCCAGAPFWARMFSSLEALGLDHYMGLHIKRQGVVIYFNN